MKKHLIAAAVAAAVAVPAMAQNVNISGRIDAGYSMTTSNAAGSATKTDTDQITTGVFTTQRLTLTGSEDLGGGLKASFAMESTIDQNRAMTFGDRAFNATVSGGFGSLMIGRSDSMMKSIFDGFDAGYSNNMVGAIDGLDAATNSTGSRDVTIRYTTPNFSGLTASVGIMKDTSEASNSTKVESGTGHEVGLRYAAGPLNAALAYRSVKNATAAVAAVDGLCLVDGAATVDATVIATTTGTGACSSGVRVSGSAAVDATEFKQKDLGLGVSYNFGPAVVFGQYFDIEEKDIAGAKEEEKFMAVGVRVPVGAATLFASYTDGENKTTALKADRKGYQLGVKYDLSKRTYGYLAYGDQESKGAAGTISAKSDQTAFGLVHMF